MREHSYIGGSELKLKCKGKQLLIKINESLEFCNPDDFGSWMRVETFKDVMDKCFKVWEVNVLRNLCRREIQAKISRDHIDWQDSFRGQMLILVPIFCCAFL